MKLLFVCTGNICRSPTAERLAVLYAAQRGILDFSASSAGVRAVIGHAIHRDAATVLEKLGGDASGFSARQLTSRIATEPDLILTMTAAHRDSVLELAPQRLHRTFTLAEAAQLASRDGVAAIADLAAVRASGAVDTRDVDDPIGREPEVFDAVGSEIAQLLQPVVELCRRATNGV